jgi:hypothetical protein
MIKKKVGIRNLLLAVLLICTLFVPAVSAKSNDTVTASHKEVTIQGTNYVVDASINISPNKYSYTKGSYGTINVNVNNNVLPDIGYTNYYLRIPSSVKYVSVYQGKKPNHVYNLPTSKNFVFIPNSGVVKGPATVLYWQDTHSFGYTKNIKVKVQYTNKGNFNIYGYDSEKMVAIGLGAWDDDNFDVKVS